MVTNFINNIKILFCFKTNYFNPTIYVISRFRKATLVKLDHLDQI